MIPLREGCLPLSCVNQVGSLIVGGSFCVLTLSRLRSTLLGFRTTHCTPLNPLARFLRPEPAPSPLVTFDGASRTPKLVLLARSAISLAPPLFLALRQICLAQHRPSLSPLRLSHTMANSQTAPPTHIFDPLPHSRPDGGPEHENGAAISALFAHGGPGTTVLLRPRATYVLYSQIDMSHPGTTLATEGYPVFESGNQAILETRGEKESGAVRMFNLPRCALKRVHVKGCRGWGSKAPTEEEKERWKKEGRMGWLEGGGALVWMGGPEAHEQIVEGCRLEDPRGWTCVRPQLTPLSRNIR